MQPLALALLAYVQQKHGQKLLRGADMGREEDRCSHSQLLQSTHC